MKLVAVENKNGTCIMDDGTECVHLNQRTCPFKCTPNERTDKKHVIFVDLEGEPDAR